MKNFQAVGDKIFWQFTVFPCNFDLLQAQWNLISSKIDYISRVASRVTKRLRIL